MASELKQDEEGMAEILQTNETVIRVLDRYKAIFGEPPSSTASTTTATSTISSTSMATSSTTTSSGATGGGGNIGEGAAGATAASKQDDVLIDLLDLDLGPPPSGGSGGGNLASGSGASLGGGGGGTNLGSLLDDFGSLSKDNFVLSLSLSFLTLWILHYT